MRFDALCLICLLAIPARADVASIRNLIRSGDVAAAVAECDRELKATPRSVALLTLKGLALQAAGERTSSLAVLRQAIAIDPRSIPALQAAAQLEFDARDPRARQTLESILRLAPDTTPAHAMLAAIHFDAKDCAAALPHIERVPASPSVQWQQGVCNFELRRWRKAADHFAALMKLREHAPTRFNMALALWNARDYTATLAALQPLQDADSLRLRASAYQESRDVANAIATLRSAIDLYPNDERFVIDLAILCMDHKSWTLGGEVLDAGVARWPRSARLKALQGVLLVRGGDVEKGQAAFQAAETAMPELGRIGLASTLIHLGLPDDAAKLLRGTGDPRVQLTLARALIQKGGDLAEPLRLLESVVKREPANSAAHSLAGRLYVQRKEWPLAESALTSAIRLDPTDRGAHYQLMTLYQRTGRPQQAAKLAAKVREFADQEREDESRFQLRDSGDSPR